MADRQARKRAVNLSVDGELLDEARRPIRSQRRHAIGRICSYSSPISFQDLSPRSLRRSSRATACRVQVASIHDCKGRDYWLATHELFAVVRRLLRAPVANVEPTRQAIIAALDLLFTGF